MSIASIASVSLTGKAAHERGDLLHTPWRQRRVGGESLGEDGR